MKRLLIALLALCCTTSCAITRKHKERSHTATKTDVKATTTSTVTATVKEASKDTTVTTSVTTHEREIDTTLTVPGSTIAGTGAIEDGSLTLPDGSTFTWFVDTVRQTISLTASTPPSKIPVKLKEKQTSTTNATTISTHNGTTEALQTAQSNTVASTATVTDTALKTKDAQAWSPPLSMIIGASIIVVALLLIWQLRNGRHTV